MPWCWHRPDRAVGYDVACRYCGIAIDWCPCTGMYYRQIDGKCPLCGGSGWVGWEVSKIQAFRDYLEVGI